MKRLMRVILAALPALALGGCTGLQSAMDPAGTQSRHISHVWWFYLWVGVGTYVISMIFVLLAVRRRRVTTNDVLAPPVIMQPEPMRERRLTMVVSASLALTTIILIVLMFAEFSTTRAIAALSGE